ncbi:LD-carboxypeptidase [Ktedonosporobacter rubrisoli]|uniref:LD-carboxypeptidase n=1 Tax=Ktedonosporobacter rubrisoli TaxID=2509675 RepID=A0A4P6JQ38_KTERU|nr:S66 peptidase family protein [Ktedonosporobacter rubrisoli]QBD77509.1 LD-carboxypeptidase [Ktedonosporobacter rubrisoli]
MSAQSMRFVHPAPVHPGDRVAILSPASGLPEIYPVVYELGLRRLREEFQLEPIEYPTTRKMNSPLVERARDVHAAFADPEIKAIICSIGGDDQIKLLKYLDAELIRANPKPFFGYSDNTNLHIFLWNLGITSYYGGSIMVHWGRAGAMHPYTRTYLKRALFERGLYEIEPAPNYTDELIDWGSDDLLSKQPKMYPNTGWRWLNGEKIVEGVTWGGCLEILDYNLRASRYIQANENYEGKILLLETSEEMPPATYVYRVLMGMGERGLLQQFSALLVGHPPAWSFECRRSPEEKEQYINEQEEAIRQALREYHPDLLTVFNLDFGHTDPQLIIPHGGYVKIDALQKRIFVEY